MRCTVQGSPDPPKRVAATFLAARIGFWRKKMRILLKSRLALVGLSLFLTACDTLSLQPLYSERDTTAEPAVLGRWKTGDCDGISIWACPETKPAGYSGVGGRKSRGT